MDKIWFISKHIAACQPQKCEKISGLKFGANLGQLSSLSLQEKLIKIKINIFPRSYLPFKHFNESKNKCCEF